MKSFTLYKDSDLWHSFVQGDKESFALFYRRNYPKLYSYGMSLCQDQEQVRDLIQELFVKLYTTPRLIKEYSTIQPFLFASLRNACINHEKFRKRHTGLYETDSFELTYSVENNQIEDEEEHRIVKEKVEKVISSLTPRQKEIIYLRFLHQMSYEEIAGIMNLSPQAARNLTYRAMEKMRKENPELLLWILCLFMLCK
ncbi:MAG: sigma-70 family RNA polymerase sigma factor [Bacteroides sp.]|nr:sigma-70 family RNA polymerase sigma factor [Bacteroides sp.]